MMNDEFDPSRGKKFTKRINILGFSLSVPFTIVIISIMIFLVLFLHEFYILTRDITTFDTTKILENRYGKKFIVTKEINIIDDKGNGLYEVAPKKNKDLIFLAYKTGSTVFSDYEDYLIKKYVIEYINSKNITNIKYCDSSFIQYDTNFFKFSYGITIENFNELEDACKELNDLHKYLEKKMSKLLKDHNANFTGYIKKEDWTYYLCNTQHSSLNEFVLDAQYQYSKFFRTESPEISSIYKPENLEIEVNGNKVEHSHISAGYATYNTNISEYEVHIFEILEYTSNIKIQSDSYSKYIIYGGKKYKFHYTNNILKNNDIPYLCRMSYIEKIFNSHIEYDYNNLILKIKIQ